MIKNTIVLVPFPFDDFSNLKVRPALCLTSEIGKYNHVIIAFIPKKFIKRKLGTINKSVEVEIKKKLRELFDY